MNTLSIKINKVEDKIVALLSGYVNEYSEFPKLPEADYVVIDLGGVKGLNSIGTRSWCTWLKAIPHTTKIILEKAPAIFVKSFNQVKNSYPDNAQVLSFVVPYYSDANDERKDVLYKFNEHFNNSGPLQAPAVTDSKGAPMEMDVIPEAYFAFLERI